jgi:hypothetical protein
LIPKIIMNKILLLVAIVFMISGFAFAISYMPKDTPMTCLKSCCANECGNGQWDTDGGFCHGTFVESQACISCQEACREDIGTAGTKPLPDSSLDSSSPSSSDSGSTFFPSSSSSNGSSNGSAGLCGLPAAILGTVCGLIVLRKVKK